jgi:hypothetical protein
MECHPRCGAAWVILKGDYLGPAILRDGFVAAEDFSLFG